MRVIQHLRILRIGVNGWNKWRKKNFGIKPDLRCAKLSGANLSGANLSGADLSGANLSGANLRNIDLFDANLRNVDLSGFNLSSTNLRNVDLSGFNLSGADLSVANLSGADLSGADLSGADLRKISSQNTLFKSTNLLFANLSGVRILEADLRDANLSDAILRDTVLRNSDLRRASLKNAHLIGFKAFATNFEDAILTGACIEKWELDSNTNLQKVECDYIFLEEVYSRGQKESQYGSRYPEDTNKTFAPGEFINLVRKTLELLFSDGVNWQAVAYSLENIPVLNKNNRFTVQSIETKEDGVISLRLNVPQYVNPEELKSDFWQSYQLEQKKLTQTKLDNKVQQIDQLFALINQQQQQIYEGQNLTTEGKNNRYNNVYGNYYDSGKVGIVHHENSSTLDNTKVAGEINKYGQPE